MQIAKISMDAGTYIKSVNASERLKLVQGSGSEPGIKRPAAEPGASANIDAARILPEQENDSSEFIQTIEKANKRYEAYDKILQFSVHEETRQIVIKIINTKTDEIIAEIPPEKILDMIAQLWEMAGLLVDKRV
jgi:flagellar protein FlaG